MGAEGLAEADNTIDYYSETGADDMPVNEYDWSIYEPDWIKDDIRNDPNAAHAHRVLLEDTEAVLNTIVRKAKAEAAASGNKVQFSGEKEQFIFSVLDYGVSKNWVSPEKAADLKYWYSPKA